MIMRTLHSSYFYMNPELINLESSFLICTSTYFLSSYSKFEVFVLISLFKLRHRFNYIF